MRKLRETAKNCDAKPLTGKNKILAQKVFKNIKNPLVKKNSIKNCPNCSKLQKAIKKFDYSFSFAAFSLKGPS